MKRHTTEGTLKRDARQRLEGSAQHRQKQDRKLAERLRSDLSTLLENPPVADSPHGMESARSFITSRLEEIGFAVDLTVEADGEPILVARRERGPFWVGCAGHYDIEPAGPGWTVEPYAVTEQDGRLLARGIGDNLGPLLLRLEAIANLESSPSILMVLQGEEEIGSPTAHERYPNLELPDVSLWLEETGYFELNGDVRLLARRMSAAVQPALDAVTALTRSEGREVHYHDRYLNKAFGQHLCPFLVHLAGELPYLALGPNDPASNIHAPDESLAIANLGLAHDQQILLLETLAEKA